MDSEEIAALVSNLKLSLTNDTPRVVLSSSLGQHRLNSYPSRKSLCGVQLHNLPLAFMQPTILRYMGEKIGKMLRIRAPVGPTIRRTRNLRSGNLNASVPFGQGEDSVSPFASDPHNLTNVLELNPLDSENMIIIQGHTNTDVIADILGKSSSHPSQLTGKSITLVKIGRKGTSKQWKQLARGESSTPHVHDSGAVIVGEGKRTRELLKQDGDISKRIKLDFGSISTSDVVSARLHAEAAIRSPVEHYELLCMECTWAWEPTGSQRVEASCCQK